MVPLKSPLLTVSEETEPVKSGVQFDTAPAVIDLAPPENSQVPPVIVPALNLPSAKPAPVRVMSSEMLPVAVKLPMEGMLIVPPLAPAMASVPIRSVDSRLPVMTTPLAFSALSLSVLRVLTLMVLVPPLVVMLSVDALVVAVVVMLLIVAPVPLTVTVLFLFVLETILTPEKMTLAVPGPLIAMAPTVPLASV